MEIVDKVTIIVPVYNNENYIEKCIISIINQTYKFIEIIVVDDGSTDSSNLILKNLQKRDKRIKLIEQTNHGVSYARNIGLDYASGSYILFVDGDDFIGINYVESLIKVAKNKNADMVICGIRMIDQGNHLLKEIMPIKYFSGTREECTYRISAVASHLYKKELWDKYNIRFQEGERGEDMPISLFFAAICKNICISNNSNYYYLQHDKSAMFNFTKSSKYSLPYMGLENSIRKIKKYGITNGKDFHELFVLRILCTCINLSRGANDYEVKNLYNYINRIIDTYYPQYYKNKRTRIFSLLNIPFKQKLYVKSLVVAKKYGFLFEFLKIVCK